MESLQSSISTTDLPTQKTKKSESNGAPVNSTVTTYCALGLAIALESFATTLLSKSEQFTRLWPTLGMAMCYAASFYLLSHALKVIPVGIAYAVWSAAGIVLISAIGWVFLKQALDTPAVIGIGLIIAGVVIINVFSKVSAH